MPRIFNVRVGGVGRPQNCKARHRVAILVTYRYREEQLPVFLRHLHPVLERQQLDYRIFIIHQVRLALPLCILDVTLV